MQQSFKNHSSSGMSFSSLPKTNSTNSTYFLSNNKTQSGGSGNYKDSQASGQGGVKPQTSVVSSSSTASSNIKRLSAVELRARREKRLCYYCDEKYQSNHKCKTSCFLLVGQEEVEELLRDDEPLNDEQEKEESQVQLLEVVPEISLNALAGHYHPSTLRLSGRCGKKQIKILIDNGSNHNFIRLEVADKLSLKEHLSRSLRCGLVVVRI